jgi:gluconate 2-dehydrogenase
MASPLRRHPRVTALPHIGSATFETRQAMAQLATSNLLLALAGERPLTVFDTSAGLPAAPFPSPRDGPVAG